LDRIQESTNYPNKKKFKISCFEELDFLFEELKASPLAWKFFMEA
jgi:hypothetical protein